MKTEGVIKDNPAVRSFPASFDITYMDCHFNAVGTGDKAGCSKQIQKMLLGHPSALYNHLLMHHRNMCCRTAKADCAQLYEYLKNFL